MRKQHIKKLKTYNYWMPIILSIAIGLGVIVGSLFESVWFGMLTGLVFGSAVIAVYIKKREKN